MPQLPRIERDKEAVSALIWNRAADKIDRLFNLQVSPPLEMTDGPTGRRLALRVQPDRLYWGVIQCTGPLGTESDFTDNRYWVAIGYVSNVQTDDPTAKVAVTAYPPGDPRWMVVTATNFFENNDSTHFVRPQTIVRVWAEYDRGSPAQLRWTMIVADEGTNNAAPCGASGSSSSGSSSSSSSASESGSSASGSGSSASSASGSGSGSGTCITVVTNVQCVGGNLVVTTANVLVNGFC
jgi:hypothetical protein